MDDLDKLIADLKKMEKFPTKYLTASVKKAGKIVLEKTRSYAPVGETGNLRDGLIFVMEKGLKKGIRVGNITFNSEDSDKLVRYTKDGTRYFYPSSLEYGFISRSGRKIEGTRFMRRAAQDTQIQHAKKIIDEMMRRYEKEWKK